jgi:hypothetical protein
MAGVLNFGGGGGDSTSLSRAQYNDDSTKYNGMLPNVSMTKRECKLLSH